MLCLFGGTTAYSWFWYVRSIIFYFKNGFDFTEEFGPKMGDFDNNRYSTPRFKFLIGWPLFAVLNFVVALVAGLTLMGVVRPG